MHPSIRPEGKKRPRDSVRDPVFHCDTLGFRTWTPSLRDRVPGKLRRETRIRDGALFRKSPEQEPAGALAESFRHAPGDPGGTGGGCRMPRQEDRPHLPQIRQPPGASSGCAAGNGQAAGREPWNAVFEQEGAGAGNGPVSPARLQLLLRRGRDGPFA